MRFLKVNVVPGRVSSIILSMLPFLFCIVAYMITAQVRHAENPRDKLVPTISEMADGFKRVALEPDRSRPNSLYSKSVVTKT